MRASKDGDGKVGPSGGPAQSRGASGNSGRAGTDGGVQRPTAEGSEQPSGRRHRALARSSPEPAGIGPRGPTAATQAQAAARQHQPEVRHPVQGPGGRRWRRPRTRAGRGGLHRRPPPHLRANQRRASRWPQRRASMAPSGAGKADRSGTGQGRRANTARCPGATEARQRMQRNPCSSLVRRCGLAAQERAGGLPAPHWVDARRRQLAVPVARAPQATQEATARAGAASGSGGVIQES